MAFSRGFTKTTATMAMAALIAAGLFAGAASPAAADPAVPTPSPSATGAPEAPAPEAPAADAPAPEAPTPETPASESPTPTAPGAPTDDVPADGEMHLNGIGIATTSFRLGDIISDANMYNANAMSAGDVQNFLSAHVPNCTNGNCLAGKSFATQNQPANNDCSAYEGRASESAASIIARAGAVCGVSQKALLALMQKESGLVLSDAPGDGSYQTAMGYECQDGQQCDAKYAGFFNQVYGAARQLQDYRQDPRLPIGSPSTIEYSPNEAADCGSVQVTIRTVATAALYTYTPFAPNAGALDPSVPFDPQCSSVGNLNFWANYTDWFGYPHIDVDQISGTDRFAVAVAIAQEAYPSGADTVYLATGTGYADALSAGPAAVKDGAPLLLTLPDALPQNVSDEISKLGAKNVVIVGGPNSVSSGIESQLASRGLKVARIGGADRFEVSRNVAQRAFGGGASGAYVATGLNFPDALSASGAGGHNGEPVLLVNGTLPTVDGDTAALLKNLKVAKVTIAGGPNSVSTGIQGSIDALAGVSVTRQSGDDRFEASLAINEAAYGTSERVFFATGLNFPDALAGSALAGAKGAPLIVVPGNCVPQDVKLSFVAFDNVRVTLLGGPNSLGAGVKSLTSC
jgi:putative cell wall-binding protein